MKARFVILPPKSVRIFAGKIAPKVAGLHAHWFVVDNRKLIPHNTLFSVQLPKAKLHSLFRQASEVLQNHKPFQLRIIGFETDDGGWLALDIKSDKNLNRLRSDLAKKINKNGFVTKLRQPYRPHLTLTKFKQEQIAQEVKFELKPIKKEFIADSIAICLSNNFSQVTKILKTFKLSGS